MCVCLETRCVCLRVSVYPQCICRAQHEEHERNMTRQPRRKEQTFTGQGASRQMVANDLDRPRAMLYVFGPGCGHGAVSLKHSGKEYRPPYWVPRMHPYNNTSTHLARQPTQRKCVVASAAAGNGDIRCWCVAKGGCGAFCFRASARMTVPWSRVFTLRIVVFRSHIRQVAEQAEGRTAMRACACVDGRRPR